MEDNELHPVCKQLRSLRLAAGLSLTDAETVTGVPGIVVGSYERGERQPPLYKLETVLNGYGYTLVAVPNSFDAVRLPSDMANDLRRIADQIEKKRAPRAVQEVS